MIFVSVVWIDEVVVFDSVVTSVVTALPFVVSIENKCLCIIGIINIFFCLCFTAQSVILLSCRAVSKRD